MTINSKNLFPNNEPPNLPGLGGGGGGTNAITGKAKSKTLSAYMSDAFKISTIPVRFLLGIKSPVDENEKFADYYMTPEDKVDSAISNYKMIEPDLTEQKNMKNVSTNINQSVEQSRTTTIIQPVVNNVEIPTPVPQPTPVPVKGKTNTVVIDSSNQNILAKYIR